ncbi:DUF4843 domain-containing protein [Chitinophaga varians]|uniref:DUF4843 domain-containing protein n=1 Tax=Chitinophaga varians TaxID=2202339 RepID=A0A847RP53_9BACT|nr:DUF4843 domain-containing protein [Chitinophaga varians]NLR63434.1 DUF4843 domain-containing protein [Chitinophaga varians]
MRKCSIIIMIAFLLFSCKRDSIEPYDLVKDNIYLNYPNTDSLVYSFAFHPELEKDTIWVPVIVSGKTARQDRYFALTAVDSNTTAVSGRHYEQLKSSYIMPADSGTVKVPVILLNTDLALAETSVYLTFQVSGGKDFATDLPVKIRTRRILYSNRLEQPAWWASWAGNLGKYSRVKHQLFLISSGTTDLVIVNSYPDWYMEVPRTLYYIANTRYLLQYPFQWVSEHPESGYMLEKRNDGTGDYDFFNKNASARRFLLRYYASANKYVFIDENGEQVLF